MNKWKVKGRITNPKGDFLPNLKVIAVDRDFGGEDELGISHTNRDGFYEIIYTDSDFKRSKKEKDGPELFIRVYDSKNNLIGKSAQIFNASSDEIIDLSVEYTKNTITEKSISTALLLERYSLDEEARTITIGGAKLEIGRHEIPIKKIQNNLDKRGIYTRETLAEMVFNDFSIETEAKQLGISEMMLTSLLNYTINSIPLHQLEIIKTNANAPKFTGGLDINDPDYNLIASELQLNKFTELSVKEIIKLKKLPDLFFFYFGALESVDLRPYLGLARNQGGRGTCTAFCSTTVVEAMEFHRDPRNKPINLSEELTFWYSKSGNLHSAGGYGGLTALQHYADFGGCEEVYLPYSGTQLGSNHAHVPIADIAIDRAQFYRNGKAVALPSRDITAVKETLKTGRCVGIACGTFGWSTNTGQVTMPSPLNSKGISGGHCVSIVGFIDRSDLHKDLEGGFFIVRNSWGGLGSNSHILGEEYNGHLLMPYGWYRRYSHSAFTMIDNDGDEEKKDRNWLVEYFENKTLSGAPIDSVKVKINTGFINIEFDKDVPKEINELDFDWGTGSVLNFNFDLPNLPLKDDFSIRFTKLKRFEEGYYKFTLSGDDGIRLYVDDQLVINAWKLQASTTYTAQHYLTGGDHVIRVEYYENKLKANVSLGIEAINITYNLFANNSLEGSATATFTSSRTKLEWRHAPPVIQTIKPGAFSMRGIGNFYFKGGSYKFHSLHTGGCKIWIDKTLVLDDWLGLNNTGASVNISKGYHSLKVEYQHSTVVPAMGSGTYYKAALHFGWSEDFWLTDFHHDPVRWDIAKAHWPNPDSYYEGFRTLSLTGNSELQTNYAVSDQEPWMLNFGKIDQFLDAIPAAKTMETDNISLHLRRRIFIAKDAYYNAKLECDDGHRLIINGKELVEDHHLTSQDPRNKDVWLKAGYHDVAIEYANTHWGGRLNFKLEKVKWTVKYYDGINFDVFKEQKTLNSLSEVTSSLPVGLGSDTFSVRANRTIWLPIGRYRFQIKGDDGVRLKIDGITKIDGWAVQAAKDYHTFIEHKGGYLKLEVEYFENRYSQELEFHIIPEGYFGTYYKGTNLQNPIAETGLDRNVPIAYRFEPVIDFDWGSGNRLDRVGSNNFSARWVGKVSLPVGRYIVKLDADDGVRLFINGRLLIDEWSTHTVTTYTRSIDLVGREHEVKLEYFEKSGNAVCKLAFIRDL